MQLDTNLITSCSNVLKVYALTERSIDLRVTSTFNDRIIDIIRVPTSRQAFKAPSVPKQKQQAVQKTGKLSRGVRRVVDFED